MSNRCSLGIVRQQIITVSSKQEWIPHYFFLPQLCVINLSYKGEKTHTTVGKGFITGNVPTLRFPENLYQKRLSLKTNFQLARRDRPQIQNCNVVNIERYLACSTVSTWRDKNVVMFQLCHVAHGRNRSWNKTCSLWALKTTERWQINSELVQVSYQHVRAPYWLRTEPCTRAFVVVYFWQVLTYFTGTGNIVLHSSGYNFCKFYLTFSLRPGRSIPHCCLHYMSVWGFGG